MKALLYTLANLLREYNTTHYPSQEATARLLEQLRLSMLDVPGPRVARFATVLELLATDAVP